MTFPFFSFPFELKRKKIYSGDSLGVTSYRRLVHSRLERTYSRSRIVAPNGSASLVNERTQEENIRAARFRDPREPSASNGEISCRIIRVINHGGGIFLRCWTAASQHANRPLKSAKKYYYKGAIRGRLSLCCVSSPILSIESTFL